MCWNEEISKIINQPQEQKRIINLKQFNKNSEKSSTDLRAYVLDKLGQDKTTYIDMGKKKYITKQQLQLRKYTVDNLLNKQQLIQLEKPKSSLKEVLRNKRYMRDTLTNLGSTKLFALEQIPAQSYKIDSGIKSSSKLTQNIIAGLGMKSILKEKQITKQKQISQTKTIQNIMQGLSFAQPQAQQSRQKQVQKQAQKQLQKQIQQLTTISPIRPISRIPRTTVPKTPKRFIRPIIFPSLDFKVKQKIKKQKKTKEYNVFADFPDLSTRLLGLKPQVLKRNEVEKELRRIKTGLEIRKGVIIQW